jgi:DNA-binding CsgD family transcriptional regulator
VTDLIPQIYEAGSGQSSWDDVMSNLAQRLGAGGHLTYEEVKNPAHGKSSVISNKGFAPEVLGRYFEHYAGCNVWAASDAMVPGAVFTSSMLYPDERLKRTEYWSGWLRHVDVFYVVGGIIHDDSASRTKVSFVRPERGARFDAHHRRLLEGFVPHLRASLSAQKRLAQSRSLLTPLLNTLNELDQGVVLLRSDRTVVHMNDSARALLRGQSALEVKGDRLDFASAEWNEQFRALARPDRQLARSETVYLRVRAAGGQMLQATLMRLADDVAGPRHLVLFIKQQRSDNAAEVALRKLYGLSPTEAQLASLLAQGRSVNEVAQARAVSIHTVRSQLKSVMQKLDVKRQAEIVQIINGFVHRFEP